MRGKFCKSELGHRRAPSPQLRRAAGGGQDEEASAAGTSAGRGRERGDEVREVPWVEWVPGERSHPRVQFYISQKETWVVLFSASQITAKEAEAALTHVSLFRAF